MRHRIQIVAFVLMLVGIHLISLSYPRDKHYWYSLGVLDLIFLSWLLYGLLKPGKFKDILKRTFLFK